MGGAVALVTSLMAGVAHGQDVATAEMLFREGKRLMESREYAQACPKLAESNRIDPATGTLLALALCHQNEGKLASAWAEYQEVVSRAQKEASPEREKAASARAAALEGRLSGLTVDVSAESATVVGLEVKRDGTVLGQAAWGLRIPMDGGEHIVEASAPGRKPWSAKVTLAMEKDSQQVAVPVLEELGRAETVGPTSTPPNVTTELLREPSPTPANAGAAAPQPQEAQGRTSWIPIVAWSGIGVGVAAVATGAVIALSAKSSYNNAIGHCGSNIGAPSDNLCDPAHTEERNRAVSEASGASWLVAGGAAVAATGVVLLLTGPKKRKTDAPQTGLNIVPGGIVLRGEF